MTIAYIGTYCNALCPVSGRKTAAYRRLFKIRLVANPLKRHEETLQTEGSRRGILATEGAKFPEIP